MVWCSFLFCLYFHFGASADRCIQNIYRQLRQETGTPDKYPGVLASLLMLDKLSIEDIKANVTELMAGGVDTVRKKQWRQKWMLSSIWPRKTDYILLCVTDLYHTAVDTVWTSQAPQPPRRAEGRGGHSSGWEPGRHVGDAETDSTGQRSSEGNTEVKTQSDQLEIVVSSEGGFSHGIFLIPQVTPGCSELAKIHSWRYHYSKLPHPSWGTLLAFEHLSIVEQTLFNFLCFYPSLFRLWCS